MATRVAVDVQLNAFTSMLHTAKRLDVLHCPTTPGTRYDGLISQDKAVCASLPSAMA
jgi:hypothetical protein